MFNSPNGDEMDYIGLFLEAFLYGLYSGIFALYLKYHVSKQDTSKTQNLIFYSICVLYISSASVFVCDIALCICQSRSVELWLPISQSRILIAQTILFACCDFIAQLILIYRCWIVWGRNIRIVIIPSMLALAFLVVWIVTGTPCEASAGDLQWLYPVTVDGLALSLTVNALVTGLIVFRIFQVFREVKATSDDKILGATGGSKLRRTILVLIESAFSLFSIQFARLVVNRWEFTGGAFPVISAIHEMLNGITPTIILVRTSMGLSFHDEKSMEEVAIETLRFASNHPNSAPEMGSIGIVGGEDDIYVQRSNDVSSLSPPTTP